MKNRSPPFTKRSQPSNLCVHNARIFAHRFWLILKIFSLSLSLCLPPRKAFLLPNETKHKTPSTLPSEVDRGHTIFDQHKTKHDGDEGEPATSGNNQQPATTGKEEEDKRRQHKPGAGEYEMEAAKGAQDNTDVSQITGEAELCSPFLRPRPCFQL